MFSWFLNSLPVFRGSLASKAELQHSSLRQTYAKSKKDISIYIYIYLYIYIYIYMVGTYAARALFATPGMSAVLYQLLLKLAKVEHVIRLVGTRSLHDLG